MVMLAGAAKLVKATLAMELANVPRPERHDHPPGLRQPRCGGWPCWSYPAGLSRLGVGTAATFRELVLAWVAVRGLGLGLNQSFQTSPAARVDLWVDNSWQTCALSIMVLSLPLLGALLRVLRQMATARPALAGAVAGAVAGAMVSRMDLLAALSRNVSWVFQRLVWQWHAGGYEGERCWLHTGCTGEAYLLKYQYLIPEWPIERVGRTVCTLSTLCLCMAILPPELTVELLNLRRLL